MDAVLRDKVFMRLLSPDGQELPVLAHLTYDARDPYAVTVGFTHAGFVYAEWRLDRDMLRDGMAHPVGEGDVRMWPVLNGTREELRIELLHAAVFTVWAPSLWRFLAGTYEQVPAGQERVEELDAFLAELLATG
ncbi:SsgA family sporulation/cell division regulator [Streptomyces sp. WAC05374]|uniref:SsgA family sporulation/cell division regulator n=1 Tax=unclassified Streptomyces TaxID=2593676 RepID=UPI000F887920|nr:SsgA family sporulation/cell division regulator [Streptomyces sp. WAC05374]RST09469.1 SsgA family sporulation/cell division regulator [Streptomyces sp. WAC05374]TDF44718.1 SsgA family sporulation/cell division regulator [Streptomyces sp. WAC05374]TDF55958.1 SsgA family sporulation/cell division regulator [Streptomyces sp. WAC05374]TDF59869.1 SsgA family sporulation/cell division regulator [Streptomyces sp. WAC05374]